MKKIFFVNINTFGATPIMRFIISYLKDDFQLSLVESHINGTYSFKDQCQVNYIRIFKDGSAFNHQSFYYKIYKYFYIIIFILSKGMLFKKSYLYSNDFQVLALACWLKSRFKGAKLRVVYHQFELIDEKTLNGLNMKFLKLLKKYSTEVDLLIVPEKNRMRILLNQLQGFQGESLLFPNTNAGNRNSATKIHPILSEVPENAKLIGHIGSVGPNHYIVNFLEAYRNHQKDDWYFVMVGKMDSSVKKIIDSFSLKNFILIPELPHKELTNIYARIDLGLILYKGIDQNFEYCAPNKLYEYWAEGIPVLSHTLKGLKSVFDKPELGKLVDFEKEDEIISAIIDLLSSENKDRLKVIFEKEYTIDVYLKKLKDSLKKLA